MGPLPRRPGTALADAAQQLEIGIKELQAKLAKLEEAKTDQELKDKKALQETKLQAELGRGIVLVEEAETFAGCLGSVVGGRSRGL